MCISFAMTRWVQEAVVFISTIALELARRTGETSNYLPAVNVSSTDFTPSVHGSSMHLDSSLVYSCHALPVIMAER